MFVGLEYHPQFCCAGEEFVVVGSQQRAGRVVGATGEPVGAQFDQQPVAVHRDGGIRRRVDADELAAAQLVHLVVEEVDGAAQHRQLEAWRAVHPRCDDDVGASGAEQRLGILERLSTLPALDQPRVARIRQRALAEVGAEQHRVLVFPADLGLGFGKLEAVSDELTCAHIEFAHDRGIRAAPRQTDQRPCMVRLDNVGARPHPVLAVGLGQCVDVDQDIPRRRVGAVAVQRRAPPQTARVGRVAPEVVQILAAPPYIRDAGVGVEHLERLSAHRVEPPASQLLKRRVVASSHPLQRVLAGDVLKPEIRVALLVGCHAGHCVGWRAATVSVHQSIRTQIATGNRGDHLSVVRS